MKETGAETTQKGSALVTLLDGNVIVCRLSGNITGAVVKESMRQTKVFADQLQADGQEKLLLLDISAVVKQNSEARTRAKALQGMGFTRVAISGGKSIVVIMGRYIAQAAGMSAYTRFFRRETAALAWLRHGETRQGDDNKSVRRHVAAILITVLAATALVGWQVDVAVMKSLFPPLKPMNPTSAVSFLLFVAAILAMGHDWTKHRLRRAIVLVVALWSIFFGVVILANYLFHTHIPIAEGLFADKLTAGVLGGQVTASVGLSFASGGAMLLLLRSGQARLWQRAALFLLSGVIFFQTITVIVGYSFGFNELYELNSFLPMPLNTAIALLILCNILTELGAPMSFPSKIVRIFNAYWQAILVFVILVLITGATWHQVKIDAEESARAAGTESFMKMQSNLSKRLGAYNDALSGYRGLFSASNEVALPEFHRYFVNSGLSTNYPGFSAFTYVGTVADEDKNAFINRLRTQNGSAEPKYQNFTIFPVNNEPIHYPILYVEPASSTTRYGFDLGSESIRRQTLEKARDTGRTAASGIIDLNASRPEQGRREGFFTSLPIYQNTSRAEAVNIPADEAERRTHITGFILAYFRSQELFGDLLASTEDKDIRYTLHDAATGQRLYGTKAANVAPDTPVTKSETIPIADRTWRLDMAVAPNYGHTGTSRFLSAGILLGGLALATLAGALILAQLRRRDQAIQIAVRMTEDLSNERNTAIANQRKDEAILSSIADGVFAVDAKERITLFNGACEKISGYQAAEAVGKPYREILRFTDKKSGVIDDGFIKQALQGHISAMKSHTVLWHKKGHQVPVADSAAPIIDAHGTLWGAIVVFRDVSKEQDLDRAKTEFVSLASHQLRTPLSAINWYAELLLSGDVGELNKKQLPYVREVYEGNQRMIELVNALLDVSRLDLGKLSNSPERVDMKALALSLEKELKTSIQAKHLRFDKQLPQTLPPVLADPKLLRMIVQNLLSNAVKYTTDNGSVHLAMRKAADSEVVAAKLPPTRAYFFMSVADTGYGIPEAQQDKIFSKLFRADNVRALDVEGTGLGLYIVKEVVEKLGGRVWFTSKENAGTIFYVLLPLKTEAVDDLTAKPGKG